MRRIAPVAVALVVLVPRPTKGIFHIGLVTVSLMKTLDSYADSSGQMLPDPPLPAADARWALFLDVDGTLLDFNDDPRAVTVSPTLLALLHALHDALGGAMALVSGRGLDDLDRLFDKPHWPAAGLHGLQLRRADGSFRRMTIDAGQERLMHQATMALATRFDGVQLEDKQIAVALHCRRAPEQFESLHDTAREVIAQLPGYELQPGNLVIEFKPAGMDKGRAVSELLASAPFSGRRPIYLGDDLTDEHAFAFVRKKRGTGVLTGAPRPTHASFSLRGPAAVETWLARVLDALLRGTLPHDQQSAERRARQS
jgi:trehalose 6-phosphate phosphatase